MGDRDESPLLLGGRSMLEMMNRSGGKLAVNANGSAILHLALDLPVFYVNSPDDGEVAWSLLSEIAS